MATKRHQTLFLGKFKSAFAEKFFIPKDEWTTGQTTENSGGLKVPSRLRRKEDAHKDEKFEIGDLRVKYNKWTVIVEYDHYRPSLSNLVKFWPYIRGEFKIKPPRPILFCYFSDWDSYGSHRALWEWTMKQIMFDCKRLVDIEFKQFDNWAGDEEKENASIQKALRWIKKAR